MQIGSQVLRRRGGLPLVVLVLLATAVAGVAGDAGRPPGLEAQETRPSYRIDSSFRPGYHAAWRVAGDGSRSEVRDARMRAQVGASWLPTPSLELRGRLAGRFSTEQHTVRFYLRDHPPSVDGLRMGEATLDELHLRWRPNDDVELRFGRMQTGFELAGVPRKSLDRNDSPNTEVSWTDGVHASVALGGGWRQHLILQRNGRAGPSNVARPPLDFSQPGSRVTVFGSLQSERRFGPLIQGELDVTYMPRVVPRAGEGEERGDYLALVARGAVELPAQIEGGRIVLGSEVGLASGAPSRAGLGTVLAAEGPSDPWAFQVSANLMRLRDRHSFGIVYARAGDGWLISPDVRSNNWEMEARYYWQYADWGRLDVRFRYREDLLPLEGGFRPRGDRDIYFRTSIRF